jgi:hypothetical protein
MQLGFFDTGPLKMELPFWLFGNTQPLQAESKSQKKQVGIGKAPSCIKY